MFKGIYHLFVPMTPTQQAGADIAQLERDLYEARLNYKKAREAAQSKQLRIDQIRAHIDELKADYPQPQEKGAPTGKPAAETVREILNSEGPTGVMRRFHSGGIVGMHAK